MIVAASLIADLSMWLPSAVVPEAVHSACPLNGDNHAFHARQKKERQRNRANRQCGCHDPRLGAELDPHEVDDKAQDVPDQQDRQVSRPIIGTVVKQLFVTLGAVIRDFEVA